MSEIKLADKDAHWCHTTAELQNSHCQLRLQFKNQDLSEEGNIYLNVQASEVRERFCFKWNYSAAAAEFQFVW